MSGYASEEVKEKCSDIGPNGFLHKPFDVAELLAALRDGRIALPER